MRRADEVVGVHADRPALAADTIITNAVVHTMDPALPLAEAVAIYGNRIVAVGSTKEVRKLAGPTTRLIDAKKQLLLPGFNDAKYTFLERRLSAFECRSA